MTAISGRCAWPTFREVSCGGREAQPSCLTRQAESHAASVSRAVRSNIRTVPDMDATTPKITMRIAGVALFIALALSSCSSTEGLVPTDGKVSTTALCPEVSTTDLEMVSQQRADLLIGMKEWESQLCAESLGWGWRLASRDGESFPLTKDYLPSRVSVSVTGGVVESAVVG